MSDPTSADRAKTSTSILSEVIGRRRFLRLSAGAAAGIAAAGALVGRARAQDTGSSFQDVTLDYIGLAGEEGKVELEAWRTERGITLATSPFSSWDETFAKLKTDVFDLALVSHPYVSLWGQAAVLTPLDLTRLSNWSTMFPGLREGDFLRDDAGNVYAVPVAWGDGPYVYAPERVPTPPTSITDLLDPAWSGRLTTFDEPILIFHQLAVAKGYPSPDLTLDQLADVKEQARTLVGYIRAFARDYPDATDLLVRGEVDLSIGGWEAMLNSAAEKGTTLDFGFFAESNGGGWCDSLAIPINAVDVDAAYAYIDAMISSEINAQIATNLISGTVNSASVNLVAPGAQIYDYAIVESTTSPIKFDDWNAPLQAEGDIATKTDWDDAWAELRAG